MKRYIPRFFKSLSFYHVSTKKKKSLRTILTNYVILLTLLYNKIPWHLTKQREKVSIFNLLPPKPLSRFLQTLTFEFKHPNKQAVERVTAKSGQAHPSESRFATNCFRKWSRLDSVSHHMRERGGKKRWRGTSDGIKFNTYS